MTSETTSAEIAGSISEIEGLILAAGAGRRLRPFTDGIPKTLVKLDDGSTVLERTLANFATNGLTKATIVVGYCADEITSRIDQFAEHCGLELSVVVNEHAEDRNNAYSLWCARDVLARGVLLCNGDTLHPAAVQATLLHDARHAEHIVLAVDDIKLLGDEEMKVTLDTGGVLQMISKGLPHDSDGEYIGVAMIPAKAATALTAALERMWQLDHNHFYEAGFQDLATNGGTIEASPIGDVAWIEIDSLEDLARANELVCRS